MSRRKKSAYEHGEMDTKAKVLEVSLELFSRKGFAQTTTRDIARAMGMSITNIYHYYGSKDGILLAILRESVQNLQGPLWEIARRDMDPLERFRLLLHTHVRLALSNHHQTRIFSIHRDHLPENAREFVTAKNREFVDLYHQNLLELHRQGRIRTRHPRVLALNALGVIAWLIRWYRPDGKLSLAEVVDEVEAFVMQGVIGSAAESSRQQESLETLVQPTS